MVTEEDLLEKTFLTADPSDLLLQYTLREKGFTTYNDMFSCLLIIEQKKLLEKSSEMHKESEAVVSELRDGVAGMSID